MYTYESGYESALRLLDRDDPPDAIFCAADIIALGAMDAARHRLGIKIPDELSIIGFDDIPMASWEAYNLTTIRQPIHQLVDTAIDLFLNEEQDMVTGHVALIPEELVVRRSLRLTP
jgi:DNA-binding LacI/PurR family transcriptional regulator